MSRECSIVKDLLPLYIENMLSEDSFAFVEEHLQSCAKCREYLESLKGTNDECIENLEIIDKGETMKNIQKKMRKNKILTIFATIILTILLIMLGLQTYFKPMDFQTIVKGSSKESMQIIVMETINVSTTKYINESKVYTISVEDKEYNEILNICKDYLYHRSMTNGDSMASYYLTSVGMSEYSAISINDIVIQKEHVVIGGQSFKIDNVTELLGNLDSLIKDWNIDYVLRRVTFENHEIVDDVSKTIYAE